MTTIHTQYSKLVVLILFLVPSISILAQTNQAPPGYISGDDYVDYLDQRSAYFEDLITAEGIDSARAAGLTGHFREMYANYGAVAPSGTYSEILNSREQWTQFNQGVAKNLNANDWQNVGPNQPDQTGLTIIAGSKPGLGQIDFIEFSPDYSSTTGRVFCGGANSGLFYSEDNGDNWVNGGTDQLFAIPSACDVKVSPINNNVWFMATGNGDKFSSYEQTGTHIAFDDLKMAYNLHSLDKSHGIWRTTDAGANWAKIGSESNTGSSALSHAVKGILLEPTFNFRLLATTNQRLSTTPNGICGIIRANSPMEVADPDNENPAIQWETVYSYDDVLLSYPTITKSGLTYDLDEFWGYDLRSAYNTNGTVSSGGVFASGTAHYVHEVQGGLDLVYSKAMLLYSADFGTTWVDIQNVITSAFNSRRFKLESVPTEPNKLYIYALREGGFPCKIYVLNVADPLNPILIQTVTPDVNYSLFAADCFSVNPITTSPWFMAGDQGIPGNGGLLDGINIYSYNPVTSVFNYESQVNYHDDVECVEHSPDGSRVWVLTHGGVYTCAPDATDWDVRNNGLITGEILDIEQSKTHPEYILTSSWHDGSSQSYPLPNGNLSWRLVMGGDGAGSMIDPFDHTKQYATPQSNGWKRSPAALDGQFTTSVSTPTNGPGYSFGRPAEPSLLVEDTYFMSAYSLRRNLDNMNSGSSWEQITPNSWGLNSATQTQVRGIWPSNAHPDILFIRVDKLPSQSNKLNVLFITNKCNDPSATVQSSWAEIVHPQDQPGNTAGTRDGVGEITQDPDNENVFYIVSEKYLLTEHKINRYEYVGPNNLSTASVSDLSDFSNYVITDLSFNLGPSNMSAKRIAFIPGADELIVTLSNGVFIAKLDDLLGAAPTDEPWELYGDNLPWCNSAGLEINHTSHTILTGLGGRGVWQNELPCWQDPDLVLTQNLLIDGFARYHQNIIVPNGIIMEVTGELQMSSGTKIDIEPGGELIVNGGLITNACDERWTGIFVRGVVAGQSSGAGKASFRGGAVIENAQFAVNNFGQYLNGNIDGSSIGGQILSKNSVFKNNRKDVVYQAYQNLNSSGNPVRDYGYFQETEFVLTDDFPQNDYALEASVSIWDCDGVRFRGCHFHDERPNLERYEKRSGIYIGNSTVDVNEYCSNPIFPAPTSCDGVPTLFENLNDGIHSYGPTSPLFNTEIKNSEFKHCWNGIYLHSSDRAEIWENDFEVTPIDDPISGILSVPTGIYLHKGTTAYDIEGNYFYPSDISTVPSKYDESVGIIANTVEGENNLIYRNTFKHLNIGFESISKNRDYDNVLKVFTGLRIKCNDFNTSYEDMVMVEGSSPHPDHNGIHRYQGSHTDSYFADNTFQSSQYRNIYNTSDFTFYEYNSNSGLQLQEPLVVHDDPTTLDVEGYDFDPLLSLCLATNGGGSSSSGLIQGKNEAKAERDIRRAILQSLVDGGDTEALQSDVQATTSLDAWQKYLALMSESGYLSEDVLEEVSTKEDGFTLAMIRDILVANPHSAKSKDIDEALEGRTNQLPEYMIEQIKLGLTQMSPKEYLQIVQDEYQFQYDKAMLDLYRHQLRDSIPVDSLYMLFTELSASGTVHMDYRLVELYDALDQSSVADALLTVMDSGEGLQDSDKLEYDKYVEFRELMASWKLSGKHLAELSQADVSIMENFSSGNDRVANEAYGILRANNAVQEIVREVYFPESQKSIRDLMPGPQNTHAGYLELYPNPAEDFVTVEYRIEEVFSECKLIVRDSRGTQVNSMILKNSQDQKIINLTFPSGVYSFEILIDGKSYLSSQLTVR